MTRDVEGRVEGQRVRVEWVRQGAPKDENAFLKELEWSLSDALPLLLLAAHAVRASRREEAAAALLTSTVSTVFAANSTAEAVHKAGQEQTCASGPHEGEGLDAQLGNLAVAAEGVAALNKNSTGI
jgi:hypothetical protein